MMEGGKKITDYQTKKKWLFHFYISGFKYAKSFEYTILNFILWP